MKPIKLQSEHEEVIIKDFINHLKKHKGDTIEYKRRLDNIFNDKDVIKPNVVFTPEAYLKMMTLVLMSSQEIGWHGIVDKNNNTYTIQDIIVYPQEVSTATVTTDEKDYGSWLHCELEDETFNKLRFHGHSHVNMQPNPSITDTNMYDAFLQTFQESDYYIFIIINKKMDLNIMFYDFNQGIMFETQDVNVSINNLDLKQWYENIKDEYITEYYVANRHNPYEHHPYYGHSVYFPDEPYPDPPFNTPHNQRKTQQKGGRKKK